MESALETKEEARARERNPTFLIQEAERQRQNETQFEIQRQKQNEEAAKKKAFDDMLQKQLDSQLKLSGQR